jgi:hypothetical protein
VPEPPALHEHALSNIRLIREAVERASAFTSIPGWGGLAVGVTALVAAFFAQPYAGSQRGLMIWLAEAAVAGAIGFVTMYIKARRAGMLLTAPAARRFFTAYFAPLGAGAVITYVLSSQGQVEALPSVWLLLYGTSIVSSGAFSIRVVPVMGLCFMAIGVITAFTPPGVDNILLAAGFGGLHILFGAIIARNYGG